MKKKYFTVLIGVALLMTSCETVVDNVDVPAIEQKNVVQLRYSNFGETHQAFLTKTIPVFRKSQSTDYESVEGASLTVSSDFGTDSFSYDPLEEAYFAENNTHFEVGKEYRLNVSVPGGKQLSSSAVFPGQPINPTYEADTFYENLDRLVRYTVTWDKASSFGDYYEIEAYQVYDFDGVLDTAEGGAYRLYTDATDKSGRLSETFNVYAGDFGGQGGFGVLAEMLILISGVSKEYYDYGKFLYTYEPENPFSEPVSIPTNVEGGLGMFVLKNTVKVQQ